MAHQPGDWLASAAFARSRNETSEVLSRKKCRSHRQRSASENDQGKLSGRAENEQQIREMSSSKLGRRRYRRWANDNMLKELAPPLTAYEIGTLFAPPPWGEKNVASPFENLMSSTHDMAVWEPFRNNVDMDVQAKVLQQEVHKRSNLGGLNKEGKQSAAMIAWSRVERNLRAALRRNPSSPMVLELEEQLVRFIHGEDKELVIAVDTPYDRLLLHGLSQFHGLRSNTVQMAGDAYGLQMQTFIFLTKTDKTPSPVTSSLPQFLRKVKHSEMAAAA